MNIVLSCVGRRGYLARMLREADPSVRLIGTSNSRLTPAFHECDECYVLPPIVSDEYPGNVLDLCRKTGANAIMSLYDADIDRLSPYCQAFEAQGTIPLLVTKDVSDICFDKLLTVAYLQKHGFAVPRTYSTPEDAERALFDGALRFPVMVKPRFGFASADLFLAHGREQMDVFFHYRKDMIIQEMLSGQEHGIDVLSDLQGHAVSVALKRKLAMRAGETDQAVSVRSETLEQLAIDVVNTLSVVGPFDMDVFLTEQGPVILELNPRFGGGYPFSHLAGADHPGKIIRILNGEVLSLEKGVKDVGMVMIKDITFKVGEPKSNAFPDPKNNTESDCRFSV